MMATVPHATSGSGLRKFQADGFLFDRVYVLLNYVSVRTLSYERSRRKKNSYTHLNYGRLTGMAIFCVGTAFLKGLLKEG